MIHPHIITTGITSIDNLKLFLYIIKLTVLKSKRTQTQINKEYDQGNWNRPYHEIDFESKEGMYNRKDSKTTSIFSINDKLFYGKREEYSAEFNNQIFELLKNYTEEHVVELGCGLGTNLFLLYNRNFKKLEGYDISKNAIHNAQLHAANSNYDIKFGILNLNEPIVDKIENKVVFTIACLEQLKHSMRNVLKNILVGNPKVVINFEVDYDSSSFMVKRYFDARDYQNNLVRELKILEKENKIKIISIIKLPLSLSPVNRLSSIVWKPTTD